MARKQRRHSPEQVVKKRRDTEVMLNAGKSKKEFLGMLEMSGAAFGRQVKRFGVMKSKEAKWPKELMVENARQRRLFVR